jgi:hypothetical protein
MAAASTAAAITSHHQSGVDVELVEEWAAAGVGLDVGEGSAVDVSVAAWVAVAVSVVVAVCVTVAVWVSVAAGVVAVSVAVAVLVGVTAAVGVVVSLGAGAPVVVRSGVRDVVATEREGSTDADSDPDGRLLPQADIMSPTATRAASPTAAPRLGTEPARGWGTATGSAQPLALRPLAQAGLMRGPGSLVRLARPPGVRRRAAAGASQGARSLRVRTRRQRDQQCRRRRER